MSLGGLLICICCAVKYLNFFMWTVVKSFIRRMGVFEVSPKYICNILFLWYGISAQVNSPEQLTQLSEISWYVYFQFAALLVNVLKFLQGFHRKWVLPRTVFAGAAEKSLGKQWKCGTGTHPLVPSLHVQVAGFEVHHHPCTHTFAGSWLVTVLSLGSLIVFLEADP